MNLVELIGVLVPLATKLIGVIFENKKKVTRTQVGAKLKEIQGLLKNTKAYLEKVEKWRNYLSVYLDFGSLAERIADIVLKIQILDREALYNISLFNSKSQTHLDDLQKIFNQEISDFDFDGLRGRHKSQGLVNHGKMSNALNNISDQRKILSNPDEAEHERKRAKTEIINSLGTIKEIADTYIGYKNRALKDMVSVLIVVP